MYLDTNNPDIKGYAPCSVLCTLSNREKIKFLKLGLSVETVNRTFFLYGFRNLIKLRILIDQPDYGHSSAKGGASFSSARMINISLR